LTIFKLIPLSVSGLIYNTYSAITKDPITPQVSRYTTLWNVSVLKATVGNKTTSVTTHFKSPSSTVLLMRTKKCASILGNPVMLCEPDYRFLSSSPNWRWRYQYLQGHVPRYV